jgi:hypothetical protein
MSKKDRDDLWDWLKWAESKPRDLRSNWDKYYDAIKEKEWDE